MYQDSKRTCTAIVLLIKPFVWCRSRRRRRRRRRRGLLLRANARGARLARCVIKTTLHGIWKFRNKATFHNGHEDSQVLIRYIETDIRKRISLDHSRMSHSDFAAAWKSTLCTVTDSSFHVLL